MNASASTISVPPLRQVGDVRLQRRRVHRDEDVRRVARREDVVVGEVELEAGDARQRAGGRADLGGEVGQRRDVVAEQRGLGRELRAGELHAVAGVAREADDDLGELLDRLAAHVLRAGIAHGPAPRACLHSTGWSRSSRSAGCASATARSSGRRDRPRSRARRDLRLPRAERRRQDDDGRDPRGLPHRTAGEVSVLGVDPGARRRRLAQPRRRRAAGVERRAGAHRAREPPALLRLLPRAARHRRDDRARRARREGGHARAAALRRAAAAARRRARADRRPGADLPRRADDRLRPVGAAHRLARDRGAARARQDRLPHDALHGRGRGARRPHRGHRRRPDRRRGDAGHARRPQPDGRRRSASRCRREPAPTTCRPSCARCSPATTGA